MKNHVIDNSIRNLGKTVLLQYDRASRILALLKNMQVMYHCAVEQFWEFWLYKVLAIDTCGAFGCSIWGIFLGVPRPTIKDLTTGEERIVATSVYRRILKGAFYLMKASGSYGDILGYLEIVFGIGGDDNLSPWRVQVSEYGWSTNIDDLNSDKLTRAQYYPRLGYTKGTVFNYKENPDDPGVGTNWRCVSDISRKENTSFYVLRESGKIVQTTEPATVVSGDDTLLLKLYDPEGVCRKIGGAAKNSLTISVSYKFGDTTITAVASRRRKCGVTLSDNGDMTMTYGKSEYYGLMHRDQRALYEQKMSDYCPLPLGVGSREPVEEWVFGFDRFDAAETYGRYRVGVSYSGGNRFVHDAGDGDRLYGVKEEVFITASMNKSFESIVHLLTILTDELHDEGQTNARYEVGRSYKRGEIFGYVDDGGHGFNYVCVEDISEYENISFENIKAKVKRTVEGDPFTSGLSNEDARIQPIEAAIPVFLRYVASSMSSHATGSRITGTSRPNCNFSVRNSILENKLFLLENNNIQIAGIGKYSDGRWVYFIYGPGSRAGEIENLRKVSSVTDVVVCNNLEELLKVYDVLKSGLGIDRRYSREQCMSFVKGIEHKVGEVLEENGERLILASAPSYGTENWDKDDFMKRCTIAPKTTIISEATMRRIGQIA